MAQREALSRGLRIMRDVLGGSALLVSLVHYSRDVLMPQYRSDLFTIHDPNKLKAIFRVMQRMGVPNEEAKRIGVYLGSSNQLLGSKYGITGPALILRPEVVDSLSLTDKDPIMVPGLGVLPIQEIPPIYKQRILSEKRIYPFQLHREAIIAHEIVHYKEEHSLIAGSVISGGILSTVLLARKSPAMTLMMACALAWGSHAMHQHFELSADRLAGLKMGLPTVQAMKEQFVARKAHLDQVASHGPVQQQLGLFREKVWSWLFHVSIDKRIEALEQLEIEMKVLSEAQLQRRN